MKPLRCRLAAWFPVFLSTLETSRWYCTRVRRRHNQACRFGKSRTTRHCSSAVIADQRAISSILRLQPVHRLFSFSLQTSTQGDGGKPGRGGVFGATSAMSFTRDANRLSLSIFCKHKDLKSFLNVVSCCMSRAFRRKTKPAFSGRASYNGRALQAIGQAPRKLLPS